MIRIAYSPVYKYVLPDGHRFPMEKYELIPQQLLYEGTIEKDQFFHPQALSEEHILLTHTKTYWDKLQHQSLSRKEERAIGFPMRHDLITRGRHIAQGTLDCARFAMDGGKCALNIAGGTHHSFADKGEGFCVYNDIAIASNVLLANGDVKKILVIDLDVHQGNGTAKIFEKEKRVFTFSVHGEKNYPHRKEISDLDIGLPDKTGDADYLKVVEEYVPKLIEQEKPDLLFYLSGVDILETDKLGRLAVSLAGCKRRDEIVFENASAYDLPIAVSMGGGYSERLADIVEAHANTYRTAMGILG